MITALVGASVFDGQNLHQGKAVLLEGGLISGLVQFHDVPENATIQRLNGGILAPGFIDIQVNGGGGVMLNDEQSVEAITTIIKAHRRFGTTGLLPTLITAAPDKTRRALAAGHAAKSVKGFLGLHLEGPHIDPACKGAHLPELMRPLLQGDADELIQAKQGLNVLMVTVATMQAKPAIIRQLAEAGIIVSLGHSSASFDEAIAAADAGARCVTHLYNAMSPLTHRAPGLVGATLESGLLSCGLICDGHHVHPAAMRAALRAKSGPGRIVLVTDAMSTVGSHIASFTLDGRTILRGEGRLTLADGTLAGADIDMMTCVNNAVSMLHISMEEALRMASAYPAALIGESHRRGHIQAGFMADLVHIGDDKTVKATWVSGEGEFYE